MRTDGTQAELGVTVRDKDDTDTTVNSLCKRVVTLNAKVEKLRKQVCDLQMVSANQEVQIAQMEKQCEKGCKDL